ncbi:MAG: transglutaminase family protein [Chthoniobacterales bacterium]|nr:transglutaminase family protein [Chthoniobacterales bacterium]
MKSTVAAIGKSLRSHGVVLTLGAEPTCVPVKPSGAEWSVAATGPTKLGYARRLAEALIGQSLHGGAIFFSPGKLYPGEVNPRWALHVVARRDGRPMARARGARRAAKVADVAAFLKKLAGILGVAPRVQKLADPLRGGSDAWVVPLDHDGRRWISPALRWPRSAKLLHAEGPAGLRLPWDAARGKGARRAFTVQIRDGRLEVFLPPFIQEHWSRLLAAVDAAVPAGVGCSYCGYVPDDTAEVWRCVVVAADPGVLEINLPPCADVAAYDKWLRVLDKAQKAAGLRTWKRGAQGQSAGTGGGHHLLFGGETMETNPFFTRPGWIASMLRFWQHHPSLAYLFTGCYVGASSQAPRPDESGKSLHDLEMACSWLEELPAGRDHRSMITDTLIHLHSDSSGNTHRAEMSFDKFWNTRFPGGMRGLIEFRAIESLPKVSWTSSVALLWCALAAHLLARPFRSALRDFGDTLHDRYFLPTVLWDDLDAVLGELRESGFKPDAKNFRSIWEWRFPVVLDTGDGLTVRRGLEAWPLLCETPLEGGSTSRFVDTSMERIEFVAGRDFARRHKLRINGRALPLREWKSGVHLAGLRFRKSALYPSLHPGLPVQLPLVLELEGPTRTRRFRMTARSGKFSPCTAKVPAPRAGAACQRANPGLLTFDLRL